MLHNLFMSPFYGRYKVENHKELTSALAKTAELEEAFSVEGNKEKWLRAFQL